MVVVAAAGAVVECLQGYDFPASEVPRLSTI